MSQFVESLCRLYKAGNVDIKKLGELLAFNKITKQEYEYIIASNNEQ
jgi:hypothetical protein